MIKDILIYNKMETRTLAIDKELYEEAQRFANSKGADLTILVEAYLKSLLKEEGVEGYENIEIPTFYIDEKKPIYKNVPLLDSAEQGDAVLLLFEVFDNVFGIHSHVPDVN